MYKGVLYCFILNYRKVGGMWRLSIFQSQECGIIDFSVGGMWKLFILSRRSKVMNVLVIYHLSCRGMESG